MTDLSNVHDTSGGEIMREIKPVLGWHQSMIIKTEKMPANDKGNQQLQIRFRVMHGEFENREVSAFLSLWNDSAVAVEIANRELNSICAGVGMLRSTLTDSAQLEGKLIDVRYGPQKNKPEFSEPKQYRPVNSMHGGPARIAGNADGDGQTSAPWKRSAS